MNWEIFMVIVWKYYWKDPSSNLGCFTPQILADNGILVLKSSRNFEQEELAHPFFIATPLNRK